MSTPTIVHLLRHGEVHNPRKVLYGRLPGYRLSGLGEQMAQRAADAFAGADIARIVSSPLERAQQTAEPIARATGAAIDTDERVIEADNVFEGEPVGVGDGVLKHPGYWKHLWNPVRPSWGEPYRVIADRMTAAIDDARRAAPGRETVIVSHQLPIWIARLAVEGRSFVHDPRRRQCTLASITSIVFSDDRVVAVAYSEPSADLLPGASPVAGA